MGWFSRRNRTSAWIAQDFRLRVDLNELKLNGIACGDLADCLDFLGPGEHGTLRNEYRFPAKGVTLTIEGEILSAFQVFLKPGEDEPGMSPFSGTILHDGKPLSLGAKAGVASLIAILGEAEVFEETREHRILTYTSFEREWELILDREGRAVAIGVYH